MADHTIVGITAEQTHPLRRSVLRDGTPSSAVVFDGDDLDGTFHLGAVVDGRLVSVSTWLPRSFPGVPGPAVQLRGMATDPSVRGAGLGRELVDAGVARCRAAGVARVWARARVPALAFYERCGFSTSGPEYVDDATGLPHRDIVFDLDP